MTKPNWRKWADEYVPSKKRGQVIAKMDGSYVCLHYAHGYWRITACGESVDEWLDVEDTEWCYADEVFGEDE